MRPSYSICILAFILNFIAAVTLNAQNRANGSASVTVTVLPSAGVEVQERVSSQSVKGIQRQDYVVKVHDTGTYSLRVYDKSNDSHAVSMVLGTNNSYLLQNSTADSKKIVEVALLSS